MTSQRASYPLRLEPILNEKIKKLAKINDRTFKGQLENMLKIYITQYEKENGEIISKEEQ